MVFALETNPLLQTLCNSEILLMVLNSSNRQDLKSTLSGMLK